MVVLVLVIMTAVAAVAGPIRLKYQRGLCEPSAEFITRNSQGNDAPENLNTNDTVDEEEEGVKEEIEDDDKEKDSPTKPRVVVVGSGPAGLFAALVLADAGSGVDFDFCNCFGFCFLIEGFVASLRIARL